MVESLEQRVFLSASTSASATIAVPALGGSAAGAPTATPVGFTPAEITADYNIAGTHFGSVNGNGAGQTIAIIDPYNAPNIFGDLAEFDDQFQLPATTLAQTKALLRVVNQTGGSVLPPVDNTGGQWGVEESMDVEWMHAIAPGAKLLLVECNSANFSDMIAHGVNYARSQPGVSVVSMSFTGGESPEDLVFDQYFTTPAHHNGVTFLAATGDTQPDAGYPAVSPRVVAVGGTILIAGPNGSYQTEVADTYKGGGISSYERQPGYQDSLVTQNQTFRTTPDVSFESNQPRGVAVYDSYDFASPWQLEAGTSLACVCWGGIIAIADQGRSLAKLDSLDGATGTLPRLYNMPGSDFHDIISGDNGFTTQPGYDLATGRGSPIANKVIADLLHNPAGPQVVADSVTGIPVNKVVSANFTFSQSMNPKSFSLADVEEFTGPGRLNLIHQITGYAWSNSNTTLQLRFNALTTNGNYTLVLGPHVEANGTNKRLDQNFNGIAGDSGDIYIVQFSIASSVGPDKFGYVARAAAYQNIALAAGASGVTSILANTDDGSAQISLGSNTFNYYGTNYSSLFVNTNGIVTFNEGDTINLEYANDDMTQDPSQPTIAPLWDDWTTTRGSSEHVLYKFINSTKTGVPQDLVIEWSAVQNQGAFAMGNATPATFEVVLQLNTSANPGTIMFNYQNLNVNEANFDNGGSATVGITNGGAAHDPLLISLDNPTAR